MTRRRACAAAAAPIGVALIGAALLGAQGNPRDHHVFVGVTTDAGAPVTDLGVADFTVKEDGRAREILRVAPAPSPTHVALLVDDSAASLQNIAELRQGALAFIQQTGTWADAPEIGLWSTGGRSARQVDFAPAGPLLDRALTRLVPQQQSGAYLLEAILDVCQDLKKRQAPRPMLVAFVAEGGPEFSDETHQRVADALKLVGASLWAVVLDAPGSNLSSQALRERAAVTEDVVRASGGRTVHVLSKDGIVGAFGRIAAAAATRYDVTYSRSDLNRPSRLTVEVRDASLKVFAPQWADK